MPADQTAAIFGPVDAILGFHRQVLSSLEERCREYSPMSKVGDVILRVAPFLKMYQQYLNNYEHALQVLDAAQKHNADFKQFLDVRAAHFAGLGPDEPLVPRRPRTIIRRWAT